MGIYNFRERFVPHVLSGAKTHTIHRRRARPDSPGKTLHLYAGLRRKGARLLLRVKCTCVEPIAVDRYGNIDVDGIRLDASERDALAKRDGFPGGWPEMLAYWREREGLPFVGDLIHWKWPAC